MSDFFAGISGGGFKFPNTERNGGPLPGAPSGANATPDGQFNFNSALLEGITPFAGPKGGNPGSDRSYQQVSLSLSFPYSLSLDVTLSLCLTFSVSCCNSLSVSLAVYISLSSRYPQVPHRIQKIVHQIWLPSPNPNSESRFPVSHVVDQGDIACVLNTSNAACFLCPRPVSGLDKDRLAVHAVFANIVTSNYLLAGMQRDHNSGQWNHVRKAFGWYDGHTGNVDANQGSGASRGANIVSDPHHEYWSGGSAHTGQVRMDLNFEMVERIFQTRIIPFGICAGSEKQGGQTETGFAPVQAAANHVTTMTVDGQNVDLINYWTNENLNAGDQLILKLAWKPTQKYKLNHYYKSPVSTNFDKQVYCWQIVPSVFRMGERINEGTQEQCYDYRLHGYWRIAQMMHHRKRSMVHNEIWADDAVNMGGGGRAQLLQVLFAPVYQNMRDEFENFKSREERLFRKMFECVKQMRAIYFYLLICRMKLKLMEHDRSPDDDGVEGDIDIEKIVQLEEEKLKMEALNINGGIEKGFQDFGKAENMRQDEIRAMMIKFQREKKRDLLQFEYTQYIKALNDILENIKNNTKIDWYKGVEGKITDQLMLWQDLLKLFKYEHKECLEGNEFDDQSDHRHILTENDSTTSKLNWRQRKIHYNKCSRDEIRCLITNVLEEYFTLYMRGMDIQYVYLEESESQHSTLNNANHLMNTSPLGDFFANLLIEGKQKHVESRKTFPHIADADACLIAHLCQNGIKIKIGVKYYILKHTHFKRDVDKESSTEGGWFRHDSAWMVQKRHGSDTTYSEEKARFPFTSSEGKAESVSSMDRVSKTHKASFSVPAHSNGTYEAGQAATNIQTVSPTTVPPGPLGMAAPAPPVAPVTLSVSAAPVTLDVCDAPPVKKSRVTASRAQAPNAKLNDADKK